MYGIESSFCKARWRGRVPPCAARGQDLEELDHTRLYRSDHGHGPLAKLTRRFVTEAHIGQREISMRLIFRLFFEQRFQFAARLSPTFRAADVAGDFLRAA